jgi:threonine dehydrogenase-like Zn-dependent dehydrogenase
MRIRPVDLWSYRGINAIAEPTPFGHEYCGIVEEVGRAVRSVKPGQFVIGSFFASDNTCPHCKAGYARAFGAIHIVTERGDDGVARIKDLTDGVGADAVLECVGTQESMLQAIGATRRGGFISYVGVPHGVQLEGQRLFFAHVHLHGG